MSTAKPLGIDVGGSGIKGAPVDLDKGEFAQERLQDRDAGRVDPGGRVRGHRPDRRPLRRGRTTARPSA